MLQGAEQAATQSQLSTVPASSQQSGLPAGGAGRAAQQPQGARRTATGTGQRRAKLLFESAGASGDSTTAAGSSGSDAPASGGRQRQDQQQQQQQGQQDQQQQQDQHNQHNQQGQQGQPPGEGGQQQQGDPGVAANLEQIQQLLDSVNALPLDGAGAALRAPLATMIQLLLANQRRQLGEALEREEAWEKERQRAQRAEDQLRERMNLVRRAQSAAAEAAAGEESVASQLAAMRAELADAQARVASLEGFLRQAGLNSGQQLQQSLERGSRAYMQQEAHNAQVAALDRLAKQVQEELAVVKQQAGQPAGDPRGEVMAWAPADMHPDAIGAALADAAGISSGSILAVRRCFVPAAPKPSQRSGDGGGAGSSSSDGQGAGSSAQGAGGSGASGQGRDSSSGGEGRGRPPTALYSITLISQRFEGTVLGGRTRKVLAHKRVPIWVEQRLSAEERQARKRLVPLARQLRVDGQRTRWRGAVLEKLVQRGSGRRQWERVVPPPPATGGGGGLGAAAGDSGSGRAP